MTDRSRFELHQLPANVPAGRRRYRFGALAYDLLSLEWPVYRSGRRAGVAALGLRPGDVVLDVGCGTGLTMPLLQEAVGPSGHVVSLDASAQMLRQAGRRARRRGWTNVTLVQADATSIDPADLLRAIPGDAGRVGADAIVFAYALSLMPDWQGAWRRATRVARPRARLAVIDMRLPTGAASWAAPLARLACALGGADPFAHPWTMLEAETDDVASRSLVGGHVQVRAGTARAGDTGCATARSDR